MQENLTLLATLDVSFYGQVMLLRSCCSVHFASYVQCFFGAFLFAWKFRRLAFTIISIYALISIYTSMLAVMAVHSLFLVHSRISWLHLLPICQWWQLCDRLCIYAHCVIVLCHPWLSVTITKWCICCCISNIIAMLSCIRLCILQDSCPQYVNDNAPMTNHVKGM